MLSKIEKLVACVCVSIMAVLVFVNVIAAMYSAIRWQFPMRCPRICSF